MFHMMNRYEQLEAKRRRTNAMKFAEGIIIGGLVGAIVGLLIAPKSGKETVKEISVEAQKLIKEGKDNLPNLPKIKELRKSKTNQLENDIEKASVEVEQPVANLYEVSSEVADETISVALEDNVINPADDDAIF